MGRAGMRRVGLLRRKEETGVQRPWGRYQLESPAVSPHSQISFHASFTVFIH